MVVKDAKRLLGRMEELYDKFELEVDVRKKEGLRRLFLSTAEKFKKEIERL